LRRCALLLFPGESLCPAALDRIAAEDFTDVGVTLIGSRLRDQFPG
jgi:hypothetical protein